MKHLLTLTLLCLGLLTQAQIPSYVPTNGLVGWWPFNGNANDENRTVVSGRVFSATPLSKGRFEIEFQKPFSEIPTAFFSLNEPLQSSPKIIQINRNTCILEVILSTLQIESFDFKGR